MKPEKFTPIHSLKTTIKNLFKGKIHFIKEDISKIFTMEDGQKYIVFRHLIIDSDNYLSGKSKAVFKVRFKLANMSPKLNKIFSLFPILFFIGLPGFEEKYWTMNKENGYFQGIYQWASKEAAKKYVSSFAMKFMSKRSVPDSISYEIISNTTLSGYIKRLV